jgi:hypothetical protein
MKNLILSISVSFVMIATAKANGDLPKSQALVFGTNDSGLAVDIETNLVVFGPPYGTNPPVNINEMLKTNGLECVVNVPRTIPISGTKPDRGVFVYNHTTNYLAVLRLPAAQLCRIALIDARGEQVKKTSLGMTFGLPLSQEQIDWSRHHWSNSHQSIFLKVIPNGVPESADVPTEICNFSVKDAFDIEEAGEYELHLQMRLVQIGTDSSGKFHYPVTWLPEVVAKIQIQPEDIASTNFLTK